MPMKTDHFVHLPYVARIAIIYVGPPHYRALASYSLALGRLVP